MCLGCSRPSWAAAAQPRTAAPLKPAVTVPQVPGPNGCPAKRGSNVKVNLNCLNLTDSDLQGRGQAQNETWLAVDPNNPAHLVASYNDYRRGDGTCGVSYSLNGGKTLGRHDHPERVHARRLRRHGARVLAGLRRHVGRVGHQGQRLPVLPGVQPGQRRLPEPGPVQRLLRVPLHRARGGASFNFPGRPVATLNDTAGAGNVLLDKQLMTVDNHPGSKFADRIYVSWTTFAADGTGYIYEAYSNDYGETLLRAGAGQRGQARCAATRSGCRPRRAGATRTRTPSRSPRPTARCTSSTTTSTTWSPAPTTATRYCWPARPTAARASPRRSRWATTTSCPTATPTRAPALTPAGPACRRRAPATNSVFRASNYPIGAVDPTNSNRVVVTFGSYINRNSNETRGCTPTGFAADGINTYDGVKDRRLQQRHPLQRVHQPRQRRSPAPPSTRGSCRS